MTRLLTAVPTANYIHCEFCGSGDSFDSFHTVEIQDDNKEEITSSEARSFAHTAEDEIGFIWWKLIEGQLHSNFNDDGSRGSITINIRTGKVDAEGEYYVQNTESSGSVSDEQLSSFFSD